MKKRRRIGASVPGGPSEKQGGGPGRGKRQLPGWDLLSPPAPEPPIACLDRGGPAPLRCRGRTREGPLGNVYLFCLLVGGFFVGAAALSGHDADHDGDIDHDHALEHDAGGFDHGDPLDLSIDVDTGAAEGFAGSLELDMDSELAALPESVELDAEHAGDLILADAGEVGEVGDAEHGLMASSGDAVWMPILSLRFWTYGSCFFGLTGLILQTTGLAGATLTFGLASGMGFGCGYTASWLFRRLRSDRGARAIGVRHYVGAIGTVLITCGTEKTGKIRCSLRGMDFDLLARSLDKGDLERGTRVLVVGYEAGTAQVVHAGRLLQHDDDDDD